MQRHPQIEIREWCDEVDGKLTRARDRYFCVIGEEETQGLPKRGDLSVTHTRDREEGRFKLHIGQGRPDKYYGEGITVVPETTTKTLHSLEEVNPNTFM